MTFVYNLIFLVVAYLLGSINTSIIVSKLMIGDDIRNHGSGNAGATNTLRTVGKLGAVIVILGDILKAVIAILFAMYAPFAPDHSMAMYIAGIGAVLGHNFPLYFKFKGGKGIVVSAVAIIFASPILGIITVISALLIMAITKYVSLGSISAAVLYVVLALIFQNTETQFVVFAAILALLAVYMHRTNIVRLLSGKENKLSFKKN